MATQWKPADTVGWDIEDVEGPATVVDRCPACGQAARLVERERVKNLAVFGVALLATERGGRVFTCPLCGAAFEPPDAAVDPDGELLDRLEGLHDQLERAEADVALWSPRVELAARSGDAALAAEASDRVEKRSRAAALLRAEIDRLRGARRWSAADDTAQAPAGRVVAAAVPVAAKGDDVRSAPATSVDDELAVLRERVAAKAPPPSREDDLAALKRKLGIVSSDVAPSVPSPSAPARAEPVEEDDTAALKRKLGRSAVSPEGSGAAPPAGDDSELAALKERLRPKR